MKKGVEKKEKEKEKKREYGNRPHVVPHAVVSVALFQRVVYTSRPCLVARERCKDA